MGPLCEDAPADTFFPLLQVIYQHSKYLSMIWEKNLKIIKIF